MAHATSAGAEALAAAQGFPDAEAILEPDVRISGRPPAEPRTGGA